MKVKVKIISGLAALLVVVLAGFFYGRYCYVFGEGVKAGTLNQVVYKGVLFKTYEGRLIMSGLKGTSGQGVQSYEFEFSIKDKTIADSLMRCSGKNVELGYKEYFHPLPWRGHSKYIVTEIKSVKNPSLYEY